MYLLQFSLLIFLFIFNCTNELTEADVETKIGNKKVLIVGMDGIRSDVLSIENSPNLFSLIQSDFSVYTFSNRTEKITTSGPNWSSICTGVHLDKHNVTDNLFTNNRLQKYPHFIQFIESFDHRIRTASYVHWFPINLFIALGKANYAPVNVDIEDQKVADHALKMLSKNQPISPDVLFLHFDDCDHYGHGYGFHADTLEYVAALKRTDAHLGTLMDAIKGRPTYNSEDWMICVISDHGGAGQDHDDYENENIRNTIMILNSKSEISSNTELSMVEQVDLAPSILDFLDIPIQSTWNLDGRSLLP